MFEFSEFDWYETQKENDTITYYYFKGSRDICLRNPDLKKDYKDNCISETILSIEYDAEENKYYVEISPILIDLDGELDYDWVEVGLSESEIKALMSLVKEL